MCPTTQPVREDLICQGLSWSAFKKVKGNRVAGSEFRWSFHWNKRSFPPSPVHLAQLLLLPPCPLPSVSIPHLQHLQTRPGRSGPWCGNQSLPHLNCSPENSLHFPDSKGQKYFSCIWKEKSIPMAVQKKNQNKFPSFILCWGIWKGKPCSASLWWWSRQRRGRWALIPGQGQRCCSEEAGLCLLMTRGVEDLLSTCLCPGLLCLLIKHWVLWNVGYLNIESSDNATITFFYEGDTEVKEFKYLSKIRVCKLKNWEMSLGFSDSKACSLRHWDLPMTVSSAIIWGLALALPAWVLQQYLPVLNNSDIAFFH